MKRRTLLQWVASAAAVLPFERVRLLAQPRELTPEAIATLHEVAPTVLPASLGAARIRGVVDRFVEWTRGYREGVDMAHGYGHPRLQKTRPTPVPGYVAELAALDAEARAKAARGRRSIWKRAARCSTPRSRKPASARCRAVRPASTSSPT